MPKLKLGSGAALAQYQLLNNCATTCEAYHFCGGNRRTAPCGCAFPVSSVLRHRCHICSLNCRERHFPGPHEAGNHFAAQIAAGLTLDEVPLRQAPQIVMPVYIPMHTQNVRIPGLVLPFDWVAADAKQLLNPRLNKPAGMKPAFLTNELVRANLRVKEECRLLAVMNAPDWILESFWEMPRRSFFRQLLASGFSLATGPTFSVINETSEGTLVPHAHHISMLMRHNRVVDEQQAAGLGAIPNLYWPDDDARQFRNWVDWLRDNSSVHTVSRDLTMKAAVTPRIDALKRVFDAVGRDFHVLIIGTGPATAPRALTQLAAAGHSCTIVSSAPIIAGTKNREYIFNEAGELVEVCTDKSRPREELMLDNLSRFERMLSQKAFEARPLG